MGTNERRKRRSFHQIVWLLLVLGTAYLILTQLDLRSFRRSLLTATFVSPTGIETSPFYLRIASTPGERTKGLMFVKSLLPDEGMLFVFPDEQQRTFWMKETYLPLDMLFVDAAMVVKGVLRDVPVLNLQPRTVPGVLARYVIELPAGTASRVGIAEGWRVVPHGPIPVGVPDP